MWESSIPPGQALVEADFHGITVRHCATWECMAGVVEYRPPIGRNLDTPQGQVQRADWARIGRGLGAAQPPPPGGAFSRGLLAPSYSVNSVP